MTPAEVLAAAADKLDALAEAATAGPWKLSLRADGSVLGIDGGQDGYDEIIWPGEVKCGQYCYGGTSTITVTDADLHYIAAMGPDRGKALAAWLRAEAKALDPKSVMVQRILTGDVLGVPVEHPLALARLILGDES